MAIRIQLAASYTKDCEAFLLVSAGPKAKVLHHTYSGLLAFLLASPASLHLSLAALGSGAVATDIIGVGEDLVLRGSLADKLVQLVIRIVYALALDSFKYQIVQSTADRIGRVFRNVVKHSIRFIVYCGIRLPNLFF